MSKPQKSIQEVVAKELPEFADACQGLTVAEIDARLAANAKDCERIADSEANDEEYEAAKGTARDLGAPYREAKKALKLKRRYLIALLSDRGAA